MTGTGRSAGIKQPFFCKFHLKQDDLLTPANTVYHFAIDLFFSSNSVAARRSNLSEFGKIPKTRVRLLISFIWRSARFDVRHFHNLVH